MKGYPRISRSTFTARPQPTAPCGRIPRSISAAAICWGACAIWAELAHIPPAATLFLHRKIRGMYLTEARLRARIALRPMVNFYYRADIPPR